MRLGVPFMAPRQLGAVESKFRRPSLPSVVWRTGQSGAHRTVRCQISFLKWRSRPLADLEPLAHRTCPVHTRQSGAPFRPLARPRVAHGFRGRPLARPTVGSPDSPVNFSRTPPTKSRDWPFHQSQPGAPDTHHRTLSGAPPDSPVHPD